LDMAGFYSTDAVAVAQVPARGYNRAMVGAVAIMLSALVLGAQGQPAPQPFPRPTAQAQPPIVRPAPQPPVQTPAAPPVASAVEAPTQEALGIPIYPGAQFITSYNAGRGQRYYLFGSVASFVELVNYYRNVLKLRGELIYDVPATHEFDIGRFSEETMAFPPSVTIKDFQSEVSQGFPNKPGGQPARFPTIIQIVPAPANLAPAK
jgi:hypothetical protein